MALINLKFIGLSVFLLVFSSSLQAQQLTDTIPQTQESPPQDQLQHKKPFMKKFLDYFNDANKNKKHKKFDFSIIGGPHYSTDTKLGLGLVAAGLYKTDRTDPNLQISNVSLFGDVSTVGFYLIGIRGNHIFPKDRFRMDYTLHFYSFPSYIWGLGYDMGNDDANKTKLERWQIQLKSNFLVCIAQNLYMGPMFSLDFIEAKKLDRPDLIEYMDRKIANYGVGFAVVADSRDVITNPHKGYYINLTQCFRPKFLGNDYAFSTTDLRMSLYKHVWKGGMLAGELRTEFNWGNPSWAMMAKLGSSYSMRGYYEGRYRDKHKMEGQVELRQHIWKRNGAVVWIGAGTVFDKFSSMRLSRTLSNSVVG